MYFPFLRGRQFELIALRECVEKELISEKVLPIVELVKASPTLMKTLKIYIEAKRKIIVVRNPKVGNWVKEYSLLSKTAQKELKDLLASEFVIPAFYVDENLGEYIKKTPGGLEGMVLIYDSHKSVRLYEQVLSDWHPIYNLIPNESWYKRKIRENRVMWTDHFPQRKRNADYLEEPVEEFSEDHIYFEDEGFEGFSDFSIVGKEYNESGFAPYAVAIHIVFFDEETNLELAHFVSDSNDDPGDSAGKYGEAVSKLVVWNEQRQLNTEGIRMFEKTYNERRYPGLGVAKKYSIMHHLELMSDYLDGVTK